MSKNDENNTSAEELFTPLEKSNKFSTGAKAAVFGALLILGLIAWFLLSARAVILNPTPSSAQISIKSWLQLSFSEEVLLLPGDYELIATAPGYHPLKSKFTVAQETLSLPLELKKLPGSLTVRVEDSATQLAIENAQINWQLEPSLAGSGKTIDSSIDSSLLKSLVPTTSNKASIEGSDYLFPTLEGASYLMTVTHALYEEQQFKVDIAGMGQEQLSSIALIPAYANVLVEKNLVQKTQNDSLMEAQVFINDKPNGALPLQIPLREGTYEIIVKQQGYKPSSQWIDVIANEAQTLSFDNLELQDSALKLSSSPSGAGIMVNGQYKGLTPAELQLSPKQAHNIELIKAGYANKSLTVELEPNQITEQSYTLTPELGDIVISVYPKHTQILIAGQAQQLKAGKLRLPSREYTIVFKASGFASQTRKISPRKNRPQQLSIKLLSERDHKFAQLKSTITSPGRQKLKLFRPADNFTLGASRREQGRRANETQRKVRLDKAFYLSTREVSNAQFRRFRKQHSSKHTQGVSLNNDNYPVVNVSWEEAALYCNWLSVQAKLPPFYQEANSSGSDAKVTGFNPGATGYRLPTETEWAWAARLKNGQMLKFPWGDKMQASSKKPSYQGNYADRQAAPLVGTVLSNYDDGYAATSPTGSFPANHNGLYDLGGNAAEWIHDFYQIKTGLSQQRESNSMGPIKGNYHVVRGPNWTNGSMSDLRYSFRDYGVDAGRHIGFRVARTAL